MFAVSDLWEGGALNPDVIVEPACGCIWGVKREVVNAEAIISLAGALEV